MSAEMYSAMQLNKPFRVYKKTVLAKVFVQILNPFDGLPQGRLLQGFPGRNDEGCFVEIWSEKEDVFFRKVNKNHLTKGYLIPYDVDKFSDVESKSKEIDYSSFTDEDIEKIINYKFLKLRAELNKADSEAHVIRMLSKAKELEKSEGIVNAITARLSELQSYDTEEE
jgi:hypothetical protein